MKIPILCLSLFALGLYVCPVSSAAHQQVLAKELNDDDISTFLETLATSQDDQDDDEDDEGNNLADIQGVFNVLAQVKDEQAKSTGTALTQLFSLVRRTLLGAGKKFLKKIFCKKGSHNEEKEENALLQELMEAEDDDSGEGGDNELAELQFLFNTVKKLQAKMQEDHNSSAAQGFFKRILKKIGKRVKKRLC